MSDNHNMLTRKQAIIQCNSKHPYLIWAMDYDYLERLNLSELIYMASFNQFFYHGNPAKTTLKLNPRQRKECYYRHNSARRDAMNNEDQLIWLDNSIASYNFYDEYYIENLENQNNEENYYDYQEKNRSKKTRRGCRSYE
jgi:hypothetical protein